MAGNNQGIPMINGVRPAWANMRMNVLGRTVTGISSLNFKSKMKKENNYGAGQKVDHRGYGNEEPEASFTLYFYEVEAILGLLQPGQNLTHIAPFDIPVEWLDSAGTVIKKIVIKDYEFTETGLDTKQGDTKLEVPCGGICSDVIWKTN